MKVILGKLCVCGLISDGSGCPPRRGDGGGGWLVHSSEAKEASEAGCSTSCEEGGGLLEDGGRGLLVTSLIVGITSVSTITTIVGLVTTVVVTSMTSITSVSVSVKVRQGSVKTLQLQLPSDGCGRGKPIEAGETSQPSEAGQGDTSEGDGAEETKEAESRLPGAGVMPGHALSPGQSLQSVHSVIHPLQLIQAWKTCNQRLFCLPSGVSKKID